MKQVVHPSETPRFFNFLTKNNGWPKSARDKTQGKLKKGPAFHTGAIQIDSDYSGTGGVMPTAPLAHNSSNLIAFVEQRIADGGGDVEMTWALSVLSSFQPSAFMV